jgi:hypothetical protein
LWGALESRIWTLGCKLFDKFINWCMRGELLPGASEQQPDEHHASAGLFKSGRLKPSASDHPPDEDDVRTALFKAPPVEWNRLPHFHVGSRGHRIMTRTMASSWLTQM